MKSVTRRIRAWGPGLLLILPSLIMLAVFVYGFLGWNIRVSLSSWRGLVPAHDFVRLAVGDRGDRAARRVVAVRIRDVAVPGRDARRPRGAARGGARRRRVRAEGVLVRRPADAPAGADERRGDPGAHLAEDVRSVLC